MKSSDLYQSKNKIFKYQIYSENSAFLTEDYLKHLHIAFEKWDDIISDYDSIIEIVIYFADLDMSTLGGAAIDQFKTSSRTFGSVFASKGTLYLNSNLLNYLKETVFKNGKSKLHYTVLHEIGHILGIGAFWDKTFNSAPVNSYKNKNNQNILLYQGENALKEYRNYYKNENLIGIPIEDDGGYGTKNVHPEETIDEHKFNINGVDISHPGLYHELMTGWNNHTTLTPLSRITIGFLDDLGYKVNYDYADDFVPYGMETQENEPVLILGDVNNDGKFDSSDISFLASWIAKDKTIIDKAKEDDKFAEKAKMGRPGSKVDASDLVYMSSIMMNQKYKMSC